MRKTIGAFALGTCLCASALAQKADKIINEKEVTRIETILSSDAMEGRKTFSPGIEKAAAFIADEMKKTGLLPLNGSNGYLQNFSMIKATISSASATINGTAAGADQVLAFSTNPNISINEKSGYKVVTVKAGGNFMAGVRSYISSKENLLVLADTSFAGAAKNLKRYAGSARFAQPNNVVIVFTPQVDAQQYSIEISQKLSEDKLANVASILPGKSKAHEYVVFSGHYDHLGYGKPDEKGDSLFNGANDDAAGTTAMLMLAKYYKALNNNERTLIFVAFTAEEVGGFGSQYFSKQLNPDEVVAMFNIEMIGTESKWGKNSAYITGYDKSSMGSILEKNLAGSPFKFYPDPYTEQQLFYRSDNATLARQGVPAHTISTSKMDNEPNYHKASDEIGTLDLQNMTEIIKAIAVSASSIVAGKDTPSRVDATQLR